MGFKLVAAIFVVGPATAGIAAAQETGAGLAVQTVPGGAVALFASPTEAQAACTGAGGNLGLQNGRFVCVNPRTALQSTRSAVAPPAAAPGHVDDPPARGLEVESVTLRPGESASFTLQAGFSHQLLQRAEPSAPGAITVTYEADGAVSRIVASSRTGFPVTFRVLADPDGNGGFSPLGEVSLPADGTPTRREWPGMLGAISVGSFQHAPGS